MKRQLSIENLLQIFNEWIKLPSLKALHEPCFKGKEWEYVKQCIDTGWVSSAGQFVDRFEQELSDYTGSKYAIATSNGTAALHISFLLAGIQPKDEVLVPTLTFVGTCNAIHYCSATPHFVDSDQMTFGVDAQKLVTYLKEITQIKQGVCYNRLTHRPIRALCVMHTFGHPADLDLLCEIADQYHLVIIEDAAEALGTYYKGKHVGYHGLMGILSFNGNKIVTTGGGGAILTNHYDIAKKAKHLTTTAKLPHQWRFYHDQAGYNYRLPNINAALGCAQLEQIEYFLKAKRALAFQYQQLFANIEGVNFVTEPIYAKSNYWLNTFLLDAQYSHLHTDLLKNLNQKNISVRPAWDLMHSLPMYQQAPKMDLSTAESLANRLINIPSSVVLGEKYVTYNSI
ncbi:MAG TPA: LegC family aminotransferase [Gammaproteobacteria bacterium]|nr:MAG: aminotransferase DegT [Gammaproteobacteria bacterium RIFCSPHIGHO2_12_FULL_41_20]HLB43544.1 LegC family aminotransferase [Gammaproteobacteria bacterium]